MNPTITVEMSFNVAAEKLKYLLENKHEIVAVVVKDENGNMGKIDAFGKVTWAPNGRG